MLLCKGEPFFPQHLEHVPHIQEVNPKARDCCGVWPGRALLIGLNGCHLWVHYLVIFNMYEIN